MKLEKFYKINFHSNLLTIYLHRQKYIDNLILICQQCVILDIDQLSQLNKYYLLELRMIISNS